MIKMGKQLEIHFPLFDADTFQKVRERDKLVYIVSLQEQIKRLQYKVRTYKGHTTKRKKND